MIPFNLGFLETIIVCGFALSYLVVPIVVVILVIYFYRQRQKEKRAEENKDYSQY